MSESEPAIPPAQDPAPTRAVALRLAGALVALSAGVAALIIAILLVRSVLS